MKKPLLCVSVFALFLGFGHAQPNAAVVINPAGSCILFDGDGGIVSTGDTQIVATQSQNGNTSLKCQATGLANSSGMAVHYDIDDNPILPGALLCLIMSPLPPFFIVTEDWQETVSSSGQATLSCKFKGNQ